MIVIATGFIPLSPLSVILTSGYVGKQPVAGKEYCVEYWSKEVQESMDRCTGCRNITEILLKMVLNTIHLERKKKKRKSCIKPLPRIRKWSSLPSQPSCFRQVLSCFLDDNIVFSLPEHEVLELSCCDWSVIHRPSVRFQLQKKKTSSAKLTIRF